MNGLKNYIPSKTSSVNFDVCCGTTAFQFIYAIVLYNLEFILCWLSLTEGHCYVFNFVFVVCHYNEWVLMKRASNVYSATDVDIISLYTFISLNDLLSLLPCKPTKGILFDCPNIYVYYYYCTSTHNFICLFVFELILERKQFFLLYRPVLVVCWIYTIIILHNLKNCAKLPTVYFKKWFTSIKNERSLQMNFSPMIFFHFLINIIKCW